MKKKYESLKRGIQLGEKVLSYELFLGSYKNINLRIRDDGSIRVSANRKLSLERIDAFLIEKIEWIECAQRRLLESRASLPSGETPWRDGGLIPIFGCERTIRVSYGKKAVACLEGDLLRVAVPDPTVEKIRGAVERMAERELGERIKKLYQTVLDRFSPSEISPPQIRFRCMVSRWGSCCPSKGTITLNKYLFLVPEPCIEYVIVHELAHLLELNHSSAFWAIVERNMPDWKEKKQGLIPYGAWLRRL